MGLLKDKHIYSYSQLGSFDECPYSFYLQRIEKTDNILSNAFSERGSLIHDLLDRWAKGLIKIEDMPDEYDRRYGEEVVTAYPSVMRNYAMKAYRSGREFLENFKGFPGYKVVSAEEKFTIDLPLADGSTRPFTGIVDLILRKEWTNELVVCDHKSKSADAFKKAEKEMWKQQYLYSQYIFEKYGEWPSVLMFHLFGDNGSKPEKPFSLMEYRDAIQWATDCILKMESYTVLDWLQCKDSSDFYCQNLCGPRNVCPKSTEKPLTKKEKEALQKRMDELSSEGSDAGIHTENTEEIQETQVLPNNNEIETVDIPVTRGKRADTLIVEQPLVCETCGAPYVKGKRKCPECKSWYKVRV